MWQTHIRDALLSREEGVGAGGSGGMEGMVDSEGVVVVKASRITDCTAWPITLVAS